jgi:hypothetical protein
LNPTDVDFANGIKQAQVETAVSVAENLRDRKPGRWLARRDTTTEEYEKLALQAAESPEEASGRVFAEWSNTLIHSDVFGGVRSMLNEKVLEIRLLGRNARYTGDLSVLSSEEAGFIAFAIDTFSDLVEIYVTDELGYKDIWLVHEDLKGGKMLAEIGECLDFLKKNGFVNVNYRPLTPENFISCPDSPLLHIAFGGECDAC